jgi:hypothetical protein
MKLFKLISLVLSLTLIGISMPEPTQARGFGGGGYGHGGGRGGRGGGRVEHGHDGEGRGGRGFHGNGHVGSPVRFNPGRAPYGGWRGNRYVYGGHPYFMWGWAPYAPFYAWGFYTGWRIGLDYYVPEGLRCYTDNPAVPGAEWVGQEQYFSSDDALNSALGFCENDPQVQNLGVQGECRIRNCVRW